jgi:hypothetical protein
MAFLTDVTKLKDDLILFRRGDVQHNKWCCRMKVPERILDFGIVSPLATQLSWTHVIEVLPLKTAEA